MEWLRSLFHRRVRDAAPPGAGQEHQERPADRPPLMLLMPDAAAPASFKLECFHDACGAESFLNFWFSPEQLGAVVAFWALTWEPGATSLARGAPAAEPLLMISDPGRPGIVFPFSFSDMTAAETFLRQELSCGLEPDLVRLYWAAPARTLSDARGSIYIDPPLPPLRTRISPDLDRNLAGEARAEARRARVQRAAEAKVRRVMEGELREARRKRQRQGREADQIAYAHFQREIEALGEFDYRSPELAPQIKRAIEEILSEPAEAGEQGGGADPPAGGEMNDDLKRMLDELERFRERRRWSDRDDPFEGFESPPGKF